MSGCLAFQLSRFIEMNIKGLCCNQDGIKKSSCLKLASEIKHVDELLIYHIKVQELEGLMTHLLYK